ncbi:MAG: porin family protein [Treponema sp.]|nr:porin family protein [Treponema sp.]
MKKALMALALTVSTTAFAEIPAFQLSAGVGALLDLGFAKADRAGQEYYSRSTVGFGSYGFLDATFAELDISYYAGTSKMTLRRVYSEDKGRFNALNIGLLGKFPFDLGRVTLFPLMGIDYQVTLSFIDGSRLNYTDATEYFSALWFKFGAGMDIDVTEKTYFRAELLYGLRLRNKLEKELAGESPQVTMGLGHGPAIRLAAGYKF